MAYVKRAVMTQRIVDILREFGSFVQQNKSRFLGNDGIMRNEDKYRTITQNETFMREMLRKLKDDALLEMYKNSGVLAEKYNLRSKKTIEGYNTAILIRDGTGETAEKLMYQVRKFGDNMITDRLMEVESGESKIVFEEMENDIEGYTKTVNGKKTYCINKKYERISSEEDLLRAVIILAHELQRNPKTGDLRGETNEIIQKDVLFIEQLAAKYGEKVYNLNPDFLVLHYVKEMFGNEGLKEFADIGFSHEGSYWRATNPQTIKGWTGDYHFLPRISTLTSIAILVPTLIPIYGIGVDVGTNLGQRLAEVRTIDTEEAILRYADNASIIADAAGTTITIFAQMIKEERALGRFLRIGGKRLGNISDVWTIINMIKIANESYEVGIDQVIEYLFIPELTSNSHEGVAMLYVRALAHTYRLINEGHIRFRINRIGRIVGGSPDYDLDAVNEVINDLKTFRKENNLEPTSLLWNSYYE
jgi:hypothetical protein